MRKLVPLTLLATVVSLGFADRQSISFQYRYEVVAASNSVSDLCELYEYKEHLIDVYDRSLLTVDSDYRQEFLQARISVFDYKAGITKYVNGVIVQVIGNGYGRHLKGDLRKSACDTEAIREKFFIFDLFK